LPPSCSPPRRPRPTRPATSSSGSARTWSTPRATTAASPAAPWTSTSTATSNRPSWPSGCWPTGSAWNCWPRCRSSTTSTW